MSPAVEKVSFHQLFRAVCTWWYNVRSDGKQIRLSFVCKFNANAKKRAQIDANLCAIKFGEDREKERGRAAAVRFVWAAQLQVQRFRSTAGPAGGLNTCGHTGSCTSLEPPRVYFFQRLEVESGSC